MPPIPLQRRMPRLTGLLVLLVLGVSCAAPAPAGPAVTIEPATSTLQANGTLPVSVSADNIEGLTAFEAHLSFDPDVLEVTELRNGGFIQADFVVQNTFDNAAGTLDYAVAQIGQPPATGSGTLLEIVFKAKSTGQSSIGFRGTPAAPAGILLSDTNGMEVQVSLQEGNVKVSGP